MSEDTSTAVAGVPSSDLLVAPISTSMELCYQTFGDPADEPILLIMGLGGPLIWWDVNRPGESGDSSAWEGWSHVRENVDEVPG